MSDRALLVPDPAQRKRIWTMLGGPGTVLVAGEVDAVVLVSRRETAQVPIATL